MKLHIRAYANLAQQIYTYGQRAGSTVELELPEGKSIADLLQALKLPIHQTKIVFVNGRSRDFDYKLSDGDHVGIFPPLGGG